jgi:HNH endonuclease
MTPFLTTITPRGSRTVEGFDSFYRIDRLGQVWTCRAPGGRYARDRRGPWKRLSHGVDLDGYHYVNLCKGGELVNRKVHRLVLEAFVGPCPEGCEARHYPNPDPSNNKVTNLQWATRLVNARDRIENGSAKGENNSQATLTWEKVRKIRRLYSTGKYSQVELGVMFGVCSVSHVTSGASWREE